MIFQVNIEYPYYFLLFSVVLLGFILFSLWKAKLISYLARRNIALPFDGVESLMLSTDYKILLEPHTAQMDSFQLSDIPLWKQAWTERIKPNLDFYDEFIS